MRRRSDWGFAIGPDHALGRDAINCGSLAGYKSQALAFTLVLLLASYGSPARADFRSDQIALAFVKESGAGNNLSQIAFAAAQVTMTYRMVARTQGPAKAREMLVAQIRITAPRYQEQWDTNLAAAYLDHCTADQLASVTRARTTSPDFPYVRSQQSVVGQDMQTRSTKLLNDMVAEVILAIFTQTLPAPSR